jgi:PIN domain nuclease of toxin-antitoxin system
MADYVIDASAVLAVAFNEPGAEIVAGLARAGNRLLISSVNAAEVMAKAVGRRLGLDFADAVATLLELEEIAFDHAQAAASAELIAVTASAGVSLGDRACLALGLANRVPVLTTDRKWAEIAAEVGVEVIVTRPAHQ